MQKETGTCALYPVSFICMDCIDCIECTEILICARNPLNGSKLLQSPAADDAVEMFIEISFYGI